MQAMHLPRQHMALRMARARGALFSCFSNCTRGMRIHLQRLCPKICQLQKRLKERG
jgi:hypothetical protein